MDSNPNNLNNHPNISVEVLTTTSLAICTKTGVIPLAASNATGRRIKDRARN